jgi:hypothetical protein
MTLIRSWTGSFRYLERSDACASQFKTKMDNLIYSFSYGFQAYNV